MHKRFVSHYENVTLICFSFFSGKCGPQVFLCMEKVNAVGIYIHTHSTTTELNENNGRIAPN